MLPSNPLQHLLLQALARPIVMTSGNLSGRPPALSNAQVLNELADIADGFLLHNRDIVQRMDDSLVRSSGEMLRRARGYVPDALPLPPGLGDIPPLLALGADMKNTFCLARGSEAVLSQHFGDLGEEGVEQQWRSALQRCRAFTRLCRSGWWLMPIPAIAQRSGRPPCPCRWRQCCITMPTPRRAWRSTAGRLTAGTLSP